MMMICLYITAVHAPSVRVEHTAAAAPDEQPTVSAQQTTIVTSSRVVEQEISSTQQQHQHAAVPRTQGFTPASSNISISRSRSSRPVMYIYRA